MVQKKVPNKLGIKPYHLKPDTHLVNLRPSSPQTHDLKKIMKKSRSIKRPDEPANIRSSRKKRSQPLDEGGATVATSQKQSPNYMKSTSSFEARKERSPLANKIQSPKAENKSKKEALASGNKGLRTSSLKLVRTLTKSPSFKPLRSSKKCSSPVILCEDLDAQRATCSSTLKDSKFPDCLKLNPGGTELDGTSAMKVCPYTYCSLNGHHHPPLPPLRCFLAARRRALKTQKSFKLGCLSPRHTKPVVKKTDEIVSGPVAVIFPEEAPEEVGMEDTPADPLKEEESRDFFIEIYSKGSQDLESSDIDWEEGYGSASCVNDGDICEEKIQKAGVKLQDSYDEQSVSSGGWLEEDDDSESDSSYQQTKINNHTEDQDFLNYDAFGVSSTTNEADFDDKMDEDKTTRIIEAKKDELQGFPTGDQNIKCSINYKQEKTPQESETSPDFAENSRDGTEKRQTTIIYNIIQFNISIFINEEKTEHSETDKGVTVQVPATAAAAADKTETEEVNEAMVGTQDSHLTEEQGISSEDDDANNLTSFHEASVVNQMVTNQELPFDAQETVENEQLNASYFTKMWDHPENNKHSESLGLGVTEEREEVVEEMDEEHESKSEEKQTHFTGEITSMDATNSSILKERASSEEQPDPSINLKGSRRGKKPDQEMEDCGEFNPRGPNFLPEVADPDAETVDLRHQMVDERKTAEEWMVDFALQQAVTTLAPARKRKVALLVEAFEKVMPIPKHDTHNRHTSKAFTNARPMQACS